MVVAKPVNFEHKGRPHQVRAYLNQDSWLINVYDEDGKPKKRLSVVPKKIVGSTKRKTIEETIRKIMEVERDDFIRLSR